MTTASTLNRHHSPSIHSSPTRRTPVGGGGTPKLTNVTFVHKLLQMVNDKSHENLISWNFTGTSFVVCNIAEFSREVLPIHFKHNNFSSFVRQLNMYGFHKINKTPRGNKGVLESQIWEFSHPKFIRGRSDLLEEIRRRPVAGGLEYPECATVTPTSMSSGINNGMESTGHDNNSCSMQKAQMEKQIQLLQLQVGELNQRLIKMEKNQEYFRNAFNELLNTVELRKQVNSWNNSTINVEPQRPPIFITNVDNDTTHMLQMNHHASSAFPQVNGGDFAKMNDQVDHDSFQDNYSNYECSFCHEARCHCESEYSKNYNNHSNANGNNSSSSHNCNSSRKRRHVSVSPTLQNEKLPSTQGNDGGDYNNNSEESTRLSLQYSPVVHSPSSPFIRRPNTPTSTCGSQYGNSENNEELNAIFSHQLQSMMFSQNSLTIPCESSKVGSPLVSRRRKLDSPAIIPEVLVNNEKTILRSPSSPMHQAAGAMMAMAQGYSQAMQEHEENINKMKRMEYAQNIDPIAAVAAVAAAGLLTPSEAAAFVTNSNANNANVKPNTLAPATAFRTRHERSPSLSRMPNKMDDIPEVGNMNGGEVVKQERSPLLRPSSPMVYLGSKNQGAKRCMDWGDDQGLLD